MSKIHHEMGMSRWSPWNLCPSFDSIPNSKEAQTGNDAHDKLKSLLDGKDVQLDETKMVERSVKWAADEILKDSVGAVLYSEETVMIGAEWGSVLSGIHGTVDAFYVNDGWIHIYDYKSMAKSDNSENLWPQLMGYALGVASLSGTKGANVRLHVLFGGNFMHVTKDVTLDECCRTGEAIIEGRLQKDFRPKCANHWCKYCKHSSSCGQTKEELAIVESGALNDLPIPQRLVLIEHLEQVLKKAKDECKEQIALCPNKTISNEGVTFQLVTSKGASKMKKGKMLELYNACTSCGISLEDLFNICTVGKNDLCKLLKVKCGLKLKSCDPSEATAETFCEPFYDCGSVEKLERKE